MASTKEENIVEYGPYGNQLQAKLFSMKIDGDEVIKEVIIRHGYCVDAIGFVVAGKTVLSGGLRGQESKIVLNDGEYITKISGTSGEYLNANNNRLISSLMIHTNFRPAGYGPYGSQKDSKNINVFSSPDNLEGRFAGFFGSAPDPGYVFSLGIYVEKA
ncbi:unnamed protein product [Amaranthus hypochondriacus]